MQRAWQRREHLAPGFTDGHNVTLLGYCELHHAMEAAITRENQIKGGIAHGSCA